MKAPHVVVTELAIADILEQADWYQVQSGERLAIRWQKSITDTVLRIARKPASGAPCFFSNEELRGLRRMPVRGFPKHLVFYQDRDNEVTVLHVVHGARDLESFFSA